MYICHPNHQTRKLSRTGHTSWTLTDVDFTNGPFLDPNTTATTLTPSAQQLDQELLQLLQLQVLMVGLDF